MCQDLVPFYYKKEKQCVSNGINFLADFAWHPNCRLVGCMAKLWLLCLHNPVPSERYRAQERGRLNRYQRLVEGNIVVAEAFEVISHLHRCWCLHTPVRLFNTPRC